MRAKHIYHYVAKYIHSIGTWNGPYTRKYFVLSNNDKRTGMMTLHEHVFGYFDVAIVVV